MNRRSTHVLAALVAVATAGCADEVIAPAPELRPRPELATAPTLALQQIVRDNAQAFAFLARAKPLSSDDSASLARHRVASVSLETMARHELARRGVSAVAPDTAIPTASTEDRTAYHVKEAGSFDTENTWTRVAVTGGPPKVFVKTTLLNYLAWRIYTETTGLAYTQNVNWPFSGKTNGFLLSASGAIDIPKVNCDTHGALVTATTKHNAVWIIPAGLSEEEVGKDFPSDGKDNCPRVAPRPHFRMTHGDSTARDGGQLIAVASTSTVAVSVQATGTEYDAPIKEYHWYVNGIKVASGSSSSLSVGSNNGIELRAIDAVGLTGSAVGGVAIKDPCSTTPGGNEDYLCDGGPSEGDPQEPPSEPLPTGGWVFDCWLVWDIDYIVDYNTGEETWRYTSREVCGYVWAEARVNAVASPQQDRGALRVGVVSIADLPGRSVVGVIHQATADSLDIIVIDTARATRLDVAAAIDRVITLQGAARGAKPQLHGLVASKGVATAAELARAESVLRLLTGASRRHVRGIGEGPYVEWTIP